MMIKRGILWLMLSILLIQLPIGAASLTAQKKKGVEAKYGITIKVDEGYLDEDYMVDIIDETLGRFPKGLVREITDYYKGKGITTQIHTQYKQTQLGGSFQVSGKTAQIAIYPNPVGNHESVSIAHEMGHYLHAYMEAKGDKSKLKNEWISCNGAYAYTGNKWPEVEKNYEQYFLDGYSTQSYSEDFATLIEYLVAKPDWLREVFITGNATGLEQKINVLNRWLVTTCNSITQTDGIWHKALPQKPSPWAEEGCKEAAQKGLIPGVMNITHPSFKGLYQDKISRVEFCRLIENLIEKRVGEPIDTFAFTKGKKEKWYESYALDIVTMETTLHTNLPFEDTGAFYVFDLYAMGIISGTGGKTFSPNNTLTIEQAGIILERTAKVIGIDGFDKQVILEKINAHEKKDALCTYEQAYIMMLEVFKL